MISFKTNKHFIYHVNIKKIIRGRTFPVCSDLSVKVDSELNPSPLSKPSSVLLPNPKKLFTVVTSIYI